MPGQGARPLQQQPDAEPRVSQPDAPARGRAGFAVGDPVAQMAYGAFAEWGAAPARHALRVPSAAPEVVALLTSGLTASIGARLPCVPSSVLSTS